MAEKQKTNVPAVRQNADWSAKSVVERRNDLKTIVNKMMPDFQTLLQDETKAKIFVYAILNAAFRSPDLLNCTKESLLKSVIYLAQIGLLPDTPSNHAYMIPFKDNASGKKVCTVIIGYQGFIDLAHRSGNIKKVWAELVFENDTFEEELGSEPKLRHLPKRDGDRGKQIGAYAVVEYQTGAKQWLFLDNKELDRIHKSSKCPNSPAWSKWPDQMDIKTAIRRLMKYVPKNPALALARELDDAAASGEPQDMSLIAPTEFEVLPDDEPTTKSDEIAKTLKGKAGKPQDEPESEAGPEAPPEETEPPEAPQEVKKEPEKKDPAPDREALEKELLKLLKDTADSLPPKIIESYTEARIKSWGVKALRAAIDQVNLLLGADSEPGLPL